MFSKMCISNLRFDTQRAMWIALGIAGLITLALYLPALGAYFISDDFQYVGYMLFNGAAVLNWAKLENWFIAGIDGYLYFRPVGHAFTLLDYVLGGTDPLVYHLTNLAFHLLATFQVFVLTRLLTRRRLPAIIAALLFGVLPVHAGAVSWIAARYDVIAGFFYLTALIFFILSERRSMTLYYVAALGFFALALASKETAITFPAIVLLYDILFNSKIKVAGGVKRHLPFWVLLVIRLAFFGRGYQNPQQINLDGLVYWLDVTLLNMAAPFVADMTQVTRWLLIGLVVVVFWIFRSRREVGFGLIVIPLCALPTILSGPSDRSFYISSVGVALAISGAMTDLFSQRRALSRFAALAVFIVLMLGYAIGLYWQNQAYQRAGETAQAIPEAVKRMYPTLPSDARLIFIGVPDQVPAGPLVFITGFQPAMQMAYRQPVQAFKFDKFPIWLDKLDRTFLFQVDHRRVYERTDVVRQLEERRDCSTASFGAIIWDFSQDAQGWEPWNELTGFETRERALLTQSLGTDPYMASPLFDVPALAIGEIEITMRVRASAPTTRGALYWLASDQADFWPGKRKVFDVQADGAYHSYRIDIASDGGLYLGDHILRLRLNPTEVPADIAIQSIRLQVHCANLGGAHCVCSR
ncbi:MAG: hypothetical protein KGJ80_09905 [Chloroflexota bacterium]|nr:hypothetical protein [Chloroflexota bacterium]